MVPYQAWYRAVRAIYITTKHAGTAVGTSAGKEGGRASGRGSWSRGQGAPQDMRTDTAWYPRACTGNPRFFFLNSTLREISPQPSNPTIIYCTAVVGRRAACCVNPFVPLHLEDGLQRGSAELIHVQRGREGNLRRYSNRRGSSNSSTSISSWQQSTHQQHRNADKRSLRRLSANKRARRTGTPAP